MVLPIDVVTQSAQETQELGKGLGAYFLTEEGRALPRILCCWGELGSGKTTFVQGFARGLGISTRLLSPTFIIVRRYQIPKGRAFLYHLDLYRIRHEAEIADVGFGEFLADPISYIVVEWPERLGALLPDKRIDISCRALEDGGHNMRISNYG